MPIQEAGYVAGSFRDRHSRVLRSEGRILRVLDETAAAEWRALAATDFLSEAMKEGRIVGTREIDRSEAGLAETESIWTTFLEHDAIPFLSWPYEWSFGMLKDAAVLHLELLGEALDAGFTMKDGSAYNLQWKGPRPCFIDLGSFERWRDGEPWAGYRQFCQLMLFPLLLQAHLDLDFQPLLRGSLEGVDAARASRMFGFSRRFRRGVFTHVYLQERLSRSLGDTRRDIRRELKSAGFGRELVKTNVKRMQGLVERLEWRRTRSEWGDYTKEHNYSDEDHRRKAEFVREAVAREKPRLCWDLGANTGRFSALAARYSERVIALDSDPLAVERHYQHLKEKGPDHILPLVYDVADPSPALGWRGLERLPLEGRDRPELVLALALVHHLVISANLPMADLIEWLAGLTRSALVIEFVGRRDAMVERLLRNRHDQYHDYRLDVFEACLDRHFEIAAWTTVNRENRKLFYCKRK